MENVTISNCQSLFSTRTLMCHPELDLRWQLPCLLALCDRLLFLTKNLLETLLTLGISWTSIRFQIHLSFSPVYIFLKMSCSRSGQVADSVEVDTFHYWVDAQNVRMLLYGNDFFSRMQWIYLLGISCRVCAFGSKVWATISVNIWDVLKLSESDSKHHLI